MSTNDGGPAFPHIDFEELRDGAVSYTHPAKGGMSLRDWFAGQAIASLIQKAPLLDAEGEHGPKFDKATLTQFRHDMAMSAYDYADAMLVAREAKR